MAVLTSVLRNSISSLVCAHMDWKPFLAKYGAGAGHRHRTVFGCALSPWRITGECMRMSYTNFTVYFERNWVEVGYQGLEGPVWSLPLQCLQFTIAPHLQLRSSKILPRPGQNCHGWTPEDCGAPCATRGCAFHAAVGSLRCLRSHRWLGAGWSPDSGWHGFPRSRWVAPETGAELGRRHSFAQYHRLWLSHSPCHCIPPGRWTCWPSGSWDPQWLQHRGVGGWQGMSNSREWNLHHSGGGLEGGLSTATGCSDWDPLDALWCKWMLWCDSLGSWIPNLCKARKCYRWSWCLEQLGTVWEAFINFEHVFNMLQGKQHVQFLSYQNTLETIFRLL